MTIAVTGDMPPLDPATDSRIDAIWHDLCRHHRLFNGRIFCVETTTPHRIAGHWSEYRRQMAQIADPALAPVLRLRCLAVCGVLCCPDGILVGRREAGAAYVPGRWQLPPAGAVDHAAETPAGADWRRAILHELQEELGLHPDEIDRLQPLCLVQHPSGVLDMGIRLDTRLPAAGILERHRTRGNAEYDRLLIHPAETLLHRLAQEGGPILPTLAPMLRHAMQHSRP